MPITSSCSNGYGILPQKLDGICRSIEVGGRIRPEVPRPVLMPKRRGKRFKAPKAGDIARWHSTLPYDLQGRKELKTILTTGLEVGA
jgi:hypothetical protein